MLIPQMKSKSKFGGLLTKTRNAPKTAKALLQDESGSEDDADVDVMGSDDDEDDHATAELPIERKARQLMVHAEQSEAESKAEIQTNIVGNMATFEFPSEAQREKEKMVRKGMGLSLLARMRDVPCGCYMMFRMRPSCCMHIDAMFSCLHVIPVSYTHLTLPTT